ncbi:unnamed protein product [Amoebophrya sp. A120]|nr:unnamed protein product [Amoebophrya sp. A120]|eukprot:GSA120T00014961001.1
MDTRMQQAQDAQPPRPPPDPSPHDQAEEVVPPPRAPKFLGLLPMRIGGHILMVQALVRGVVFLVAGAGFKPGNEQSKVEQILFFIVGGVDCLSALVGEWGVLMDDADKLRFCMYWRIFALGFFLPYLSGYILFDSGVMGLSLHPLAVAGLLVGVILLEGILLRENYKLLLYTMRMNKFRANMGNRFELPDWLQGDPEAAYVMCKTVPITAAVSGYALFTFVASFVGLLCVLFFPQVAMAFGFFSRLSPETTVILAIVNFLGLYYCVYCILAIQHGQPEELKSYLIYQLFRFCVMIPILIVNALMNNTCKMYDETKNAVGYGSSSNNAAHNATTVNFSCSAKEQVYWVFVVIGFVIHAYFINISYLLYVRYANVAAEYRKSMEAKQILYGSMEREKTSRNIIDADLL